MSKSSKRTNDLGLHGLANHKKKLQLCLRGGSQNIKKDKGVRTCRVRKVAEFDEIYVTSMVRNIAKRTKDLGLRRHIIGYSAKS